MLAQNFLHQSAEFALLDSSFPRFVLTALLDLDKGRANNGAVEVTADALTTSEKEQDRNQSENSQIAAPELGFEQNAVDAQAAGAPEVCATARAT
jgi:hypothetical protein